jgi:hypothetical protein
MASPLPENGSVLLSLAAKPGNVQSEGAPGFEVDDVSG